MKHAAKRPAPQSTNGWQVLHKETAAQQYIVQIANGPAAEDENRHASRLLATILGDDSGSRLFWELIDIGPGRICVDGNLRVSRNRNLHDLSLLCARTMPRRTSECVLEVQQTAERAGVTEDELRRAKSKVCSQIVLHSERPSNRLFSVGGNWLQRREYRTVRETVDAYERVTVADIAAVLEQFPLTHRTTVAVGPLSKLRLAE